MTERRIVIEQAGFIGTASGKFHISKPVAYAVRNAEYDEWTLYSSATHDLYGEIRPSSSKPGYAAWEIDDVYNDRALTANGKTFMECVSSILGKPGHGYDYYRKAQ